MNPEWKLLAADLLKEVGQEYSNHVCNDWEFPADWSLEDRQDFVKAYHDYNGDPEEFDPNFLHLPDFAVLGFLSHLLKQEASLEGTES